MRNYWLVMLPDQEQLTYVNSKVSFMALYISRGDLASHKPLPTNTIPVLSEKTDKTSTLYAEQSKPIE